MRHHQPGAEQIRHPKGRSIICIV